MSYQDPYGRRPLLSPIAIVLGTALLAGAAVLAIVLVLRPSTGPSGTAAANGTEEVAQQGLGTQEQTEDGARAAAQQAFDLYSGGSYGEFWDRWSTASQALITRDDYLRLHRQCEQPAEGVRFTINSATVTGTTAKVQANRLILALTIDFVYENETWRYVLPADQQQEYRTKAVDQIVQERQAARLCGKDALKLTPAPTPAATTPPLTAAKVGEKLTLTGLSNTIEVTVDRVIAKGASTNQYLHAQPGNRLVGVEITIKNIGATTYTDSPLISAALIDADGRQYRVSPADLREGASLGAVSISPNDSRKGMIVFEAPEAVKLAKFQFGPTFSSQKGEWQLS
ncbi:DUF4352 domain-containing protein [Streptosporangium saharense]|uniref:DUF4352 domain-containing protein n=1 Tax=Streptosporangium saharense TaxID=1706840 RepID=UPI0033317F35